MTNKQAELYFRKICKGQDANNDLDIAAFMDAANVPMVKTKEEKEIGQKKILIFENGKWTETNLDEMEKNRIIMIKIAGAPEVQ